MSPLVPARHVVIVTASQEWIDVEVMRSRLSWYPADTLMIHGGATGGDAIADKIGRDLKFRILSEPYFHGSEFGGFARNSLLVDLGLTYDRFGYIVTVEAFPTASSRGTWDLYDKAKSAGLKATLK